MSLHLEAPKDYTVYVKLKNEMKDDYEDKVLHFKIASTIHVEIKITGVTYTLLPNESIAACKYKSKERKKCSRSHCGDRLKDTWNRFWYRVEINFHTELTSFLSSTYSQLNQR